MIYQQQVTVPENEKSKNLWDINESNGFRAYNIDGHPYKVNEKVPGDHYRCAQLLRLLDLYISQLIDDLVQRCMQVGVLSENCKLLSSTPYVVQEIEYDSGFHGINKPKGIIKSNTARKHFKLDNDLRATWRLIMLELRDPNGRFLSWSNGTHSIKKTLLHEVAHTMCNHIRYRTKGNHQEDFDDCERVTLELGKHPSPELAQIERRIKNVL